MSEIDKNDETTRRESVTQVTGPEVEFSQPVGLLTMQVAELVSVAQTIVQVAGEMDNDRAEQLQSIQASIRGLASEVWKIAGDELLEKGIKN